MVARIYGDDMEETMVSTTQLRQETDVVDEIHALFSLRIANALGRAGITTRRQVAATTTAELAALRHLGPKSATAIRKVIPYDGSVAEPLPESTQPPRQDDQWDGVSRENLIRLVGLYQWASDFWYENWEQEQVNRKKIKKLKKQNRYFRKVLADIDKADIERQEQPCPACQDVDIERSIWASQDDGGIPTEETCASTSQGRGDEVYLW